MSPTDRGWAMIEIVTVLVSLATISVFLRFVARFKRRIKLGADDYLCVLSLFLLYGMLAELILWCAIGGNGTPIVELDAGEMQIFWKIFISNQFTYFVLSPCIKISFICFYRRLFTIRWFRRITLGCSCLIAAWGAGIFLACAIQCRPLQAYWDKSIDGWCFDGNEFFIVNQVFNVISDFVILLLPVPMIWGLHRAWQDKVALNGVFAVGGFVCFASIYRIITLLTIDPTDITYTVYQATLWTHIEPSVGLICSCLPIIRGLFPSFSLPGTRASRSPGASSGRASQGRAYRHSAAKLLGGKISSSSSPRLLLSTDIERINLGYLNMQEPVIQAMDINDEAHREEIEMDTAVTKVNSETEREFNRILVRTDIDITKN